MNGHLSIGRGRTAVVTGGGSGIGRGLAHTWAARGMNVVVADIRLDSATRVADELCSQGHRALAVECDVTEPESTERLAQCAYAEFGAVNLLCNNAGIVVLRPFLECSLADWQWTFAVNVFGVINCVQAFVPRILAQDHPAHIVNTASAAGVGGPVSTDFLPGVEAGAYSVSKHAVVSYSEQLRVALAPKGIGVTVLCPSKVTTPIPDADLARPGRFGNARSDDRAKEALARFLAGGIDPLRFGEITCEAVEQNRFYVFTERTARDRLLNRFGTIIEHFAHVGG